MHILLTRPLEDCSEIIHKFQSLGHQVSHLPLLVIEKKDYELTNSFNYGGIIFTSANAIKFLDLKEITIYKIIKRSHCIICREKFF